ncbi:hypothetical protein [Catenulispora acidiphila]|uniref:hypothetical protein n=1 Tax=Catenulispora acidiphila TaxID=304895 RepID=UPI00019E2D04|nr:hypothetical protein [Catenulispora acidiphila]
MLEFVSRLGARFNLHRPQDHNFLVAPERAPHPVPLSLAIQRDHFELRPGANLSKQLGKISAEGLADFCLNDNVSTWPHQLPCSGERIRKARHDALRDNAPVDAEDSNARKVHEHERGSPQRVRSDQLRHIDQLADDHGREARAAVSRGPDYGLPGLTRQSRVALDPDREPVCADCFDQCSTVPAAEIDHEPTWLGIASDRQRGEGSSGRFGFVSDVEIQHGCLASG